MREDNTAEYKPCDSFDGFSQEEVVKISCHGKSNTYVICLSQCIYPKVIKASLSIYVMIEALKTILEFVKFKLSNSKVGQL